MGKLRAPKKSATLVVLSSEDDDDDQSLNRQPRKNRKRATAAAEAAENESGSAIEIKPSSKRKLPRRRPASARANSQSSQSFPNSPQKASSKPISSFFHLATRKNSSQQSASSEKPHLNTLEKEEDLIQDDDDLAQLSPTKGGAYHPLPSRTKRKRQEFDDEAVTNSKLLKGSQIFKKAVISATHKSNQVVVDQRPWMEKYGPVNLEELAVHKKKVQDVRMWLDSVTAGRDRKRLLVLKGAAGAGKTTTIRLLSQELSLEMSEWKNPGMSNAEDGFVSMSAQFEDFVTRTGTFGVLDVGGSVTQSRQELREENRRGVILVEEFPNTFSRSSSALHSFRNAVTQYLESTTPSMDSFFSEPSQPPKSVTPIVMIISETLLSTSTASADSFTAYRLLGPEILDHSGTTVIEFNPIAQTFMTKALDLVMRKEARESGRRKAPGAAVFTHLAGIGDIRSAVSSLEFLCLRGDQDVEWSGKVSFTKPKGGVTDAPLSKMETDSLEIITQRESTLGIFHAVGKVVYNKRGFPTATDTPPQPPAHLPQLARPKVHEISIEILLNELGTDIQTFVSALHENYILSCQGLDQEETLEHATGCIDSLSDADLLSPDRSSTNRSRLPFQISGGDGLRQDEMSFQTAVRGLLFSLPHPVKRIIPTSGTTRGKSKAFGSGAAHQMFYPTSLRLWRRKEEIEDLLDKIVTKHKNGQLFSSPQNSSSTSAKLSGVENWRKNRYAGISTNESSSGAQHDEYPTALLGSGSSAKTEMLLDTLPYMFAMAKNKSKTSFDRSLKDLEKITMVSAYSVALDNEEEDADEDGEVDVGNEQWSTDRPAEDSLAQARSRGFGKGFGLTSKVTERAGVIKAKMERLILEDDDIQDD